MSEQDRRRYFRINDWVDLSYSVIGKQETEFYADADNVQLSSAQILDAIDKELSSAHNVLWQSNPQAANVIGLVNKKLDFIVTELGLDYLQGSSLKHEKTEVSLSACGMAFECDEHFDTGQMLVLNLLLKPVNSKLKLRGCVIACERVEADSNKSYVLRLDFVGMDTSMREELIQHVVRRQSMQLSEQRQQPPSE